MEKNVKTLLKMVSLICTGVGFATSLLSKWVDDRQQNIEIREAVAKEVSRQLAIPMKKG